MLNQQLYNEILVYLGKYYQPILALYLPPDKQEAPKESSKAFALGSLTKQPYQEEKAQADISSEAIFEEWPEFYPCVDTQTFYEKLIAITNKKKLNEVCEINIL